MKVLIFFVLLFSSISLTAQSVILLEQDSASEVHMNVDISGGFEDFPLDLFFKNNTNDTIQVNWKRELSGNCPIDWNIVAADQMLTYVPSINESQFPITMYPADSHFIIRQLFYPQMVSGCCDITLIFSLESAPNIPIDTGYYHIEINSNDCSITSTLEEEIENFHIFPNPVFGILNIENAFAIETIEIIDITGKTQAVFIKPTSSKIDVSDLTSGIYICKIKNKSNHTFLQKLIKY